MKHYMGFWLIMLFVSLRLRWLAWRNPVFRRALQRRNTLMLWRTHDGRIARWFHFTENRVRSGPGLRDRCHVTVSFHDAEYGTATLIQLLKNQRVFVTGMRQRKIRLSGNPKGLIWFMNVAGHLIPGGVQLWRKPSRPQGTVKPRRRDQG